MKQHYTQLAEHLNQALQNQRMSDARYKSIRSILAQEVLVFFVPRAAFLKALAERNRYRSELRKLRLLEDEALRYQSRPGRTYKKRRPRKEVGQ